MKPTVVKSSAPSNFQKLSTKLALQATTSTTRKSLKKKAKKSTSFFDTLGDSQSSMEVTSFPSRSLSTPISSGHNDEHPTKSTNLAPQSDLPPKVESKVVETAAEDSNSGGELFPGLSLSARVAPAVVPPKPVSSQALSRTVDSAWLARYPNHFTTLLTSRENIYQMRCPCARRGSSASNEFQGLDLCCCSLFFQLARAGRFLGWGGLGCKPPRACLSGQNSVYTCKL